MCTDFIFSAGLGRILRNPLPLRSLPTFFDHPPPRLRTMGWSTRNEVALLRVWGFFPLPLSWNWGR
jgi:hypothetical protein